MAAPSPARHVDCSKEAVAAPRRPLPQLSGRAPSDRRLLAIMFAILMLVSAAALLAMLSGCAADADTAAMPREVDVPIAVAPPPCVAELPAHPPLPIAALDADAAPADTVRAYAATVAILKGAVDERDALLGGCAAPSSAQPPVRHPERKLLERRTSRGTRSPRDSSERHHGRKDSGREILRFADCAQDDGKGCPEPDSLRICSPARGTRPRALM